MGCAQERCRCCYSSEMLETLRNPLLDIYRSICNPHYVGIDEYSTKACFQCHKFLNEVLCFRNKCHSVDRCFRNGLEVENVDVECVKTELKEEYDEIDTVDVRIDKVEVDYEPVTDIETSVEDPLDKDALLIELNRPNEPPSHKQTEIDKSFSCSECSFKSSFQNSLKRHILLQHSDERPFPCDQCNYRAKIKNQLVKHKRKHLDKREKPFKCTECSYKSPFLVDLKRHGLYAHSDEAAFPCDQCDYRAKIKSQLIRHKTIHTNERDKPFKCNECSYESPYLAHMKCHIMSVHSDERPFSCDQCNYRAKIKYQLVKHKKRHAKESTLTFQCDECSFKSNKYRHLKIHHRTHTGESVFSCDLCNFKSIYKNNLAKHMKTIHSN